MIWGLITFIIGLYCVTRRQWSDLAVIDFVQQEIWPSADSEGEDESPRGDRLVAGSKLLMKTP